MNLYILLYFNLLNIGLLDLHITKKVHHNTILIVTNTIRILKLAGARNMYDPVVNNFYFKHRVGN